MKKTNSYKGVLMILSLFISLSIFTLPVWAQETDTVTATVTVKNIALSVDPGNISYGIISAGSTKDTTASGVDTSITASNDGNVTAVLNIQGADTQSWALNDTAVGTEQYMHEFCTTSCDSGGTWTALNNSTYDTLAPSVAASGTQVFDLKIHTPSLTEDYTQQSTTVTIQITE
jgi:hypothetical protein